MGIFFGSKSPKPNVTSPPMAPIKAKPPKKAIPSPRKPTK